MMALSTRYHMRARWDDAIRCMRRAVTADPETTLYVRLAHIYRDRGDREGWRATLDEFLERDSFGFDHALVQQEIALDYLERKEYQQALVWANKAAETKTSWALDCAARCYEAVGDLDNAEAARRRSAELYDYESRIDYYLWCHKYGRGDLELARRLADAYVDWHRGATTGELQLSIAVFLEITGQKEESLADFRTLMAAQTNMYYYA